MDRIDQVSKPEPLLVYFANVPPTKHIVNIMTTERTAITRIIIDLFFIVFIAFFSFYVVFFPAMLAREMMYVKQRSVRRYYLISLTFQSLFSSIALTTSRL